MGKRWETKKTCRGKPDGHYRDVSKDQCWKINELRNILLIRGEHRRGGCGKSERLIEYCGCLSRGHLRGVSATSIHAQRSGDLPVESTIRSLRGCSNRQHCCTLSPHRPLAPPPSPDNTFTADIITTYGVSAAPAGRLVAVASLYNLDEEIGAR